MSKFNKTTKPSQINRKRGWKIADLIANGLTDCYRGAMLSPLLPHEAHGRENLLRYGEKPPQPIVAFLCASFLRGVKPCFSSMAGLLGQHSVLAGSITQFSHPFQVRRQCREKHYRRLSILSYGVTA